MCSGGTTSERQAGQWNTSSGRRRISGCPHSQGCLPEASGRAATCSRVLSTALPIMPQEPQLARYGPRERNSLNPHTGQTRRAGLDTACAGRTSLFHLVSTLLPDLLIPLTKEGLLAFCIPYSAVCARAVWTRRFARGCLASVPGVPGEGWPPETRPEKGVYDEQRRSYRPLQGELLEIRRGGSEASRATVSRATGAYLLMVCIAFYLLLQRWS